jgi:divalent metal cation (Fe/Co/Zn/Cd) transporter
MPDRSTLARRGERLAYLTIAWNSLEGVVAIASGAVAGSVSLVGFGVDSFIEVTSASAVLWRMSKDADMQQREAAERRSLRIIGACFLALAAYVTVAALRDLALDEGARRSVPGIVLACASLVVMPLLARAKRRVGAEMASRAVRADARQTDFCAYLSAILLVGLVLNSLWGWWWADPVAAMVMVPIITMEGIRGLRADPCCGER